jgi:hypothetical protein
MIFRVKGRTHRGRLTTGLLGEYLKVKGESNWRQEKYVYNEVLHNLYSSLNIIRVIKSERVRCAGQVAVLKEIINSYRILVGRPESKSPLGRHRRRWEDNY